LVEIEEAHADRFPDMMPSYQATIAYWHWSPNPQPKTSSEIIVALQKIPQGQSPYSAVEQFVDALVSQTQDISLLGQLQNWGEQQVKNWAELRSWVEERQEQQRQNAQPGVMVEISRSEEEVQENKYRLEAWLIQDIDRYKKEKSQGCTAIHLSGATGDETYSLEDAPQVLTRFLEEISGEVVKTPDIHIFLPIELMNQDVDCWILPDSKKPLGHEYNLVLRCAERVSRNYRQKSRWREKWQHHQDLLKECALKTFLPGDDRDLDELSYALDDVDHTIVGLKVTQAPALVECGDLFSVLYHSGLPLAIWGRCNLTGAANEAALDRVLQAAQCLESLPKTAKQTRRAARKYEKDCHIGHHLSLLWDDPYLVPPKSA